MLNCSSTLCSHVNNTWSIADPGTADVAFAFGYPGAAIDAGYPMVVFDDVPEVREIKVFITADVYRVEHQVLVTVKVKPFGGQQARVLEAENTLLYAKTEIDDILNRDRYTVSGINHVTLLGWTNRTTREGNELVFESSQIVVCTYYIEEGV